MRSRFLIAVFAGLVLQIGAVVTAVQQLPARDAAPVRVGTSSIAGTVVDASSGAVVRRVTVTASDPAQGSRVSVTDDEGRFAIRGLIAGRYTLMASKPAYFGGAYGVTRPVRLGVASSGTPIELGDGQAIASLSIKITRGAVVAGTVRGTDGRPARGVNVSLAYPMRASITGDRTLVSSSSATTDARGEYRIFGVAPGDYLVSVRMMASGSTLLTPNDLEATTEADLRRIADLIAGRPGAPQISSGSPETPRRPTYGYATVFYPGTTMLGNAVPITLAQGDERTGIDLTLQLVPQSRVSGVVTGIDGRPAANVALRVFGASPYAAGPFLAYFSANTGPQGEFTVRTVPAGDYVIEVRSGIRGPTALVNGWVRSPVSVAPGIDQTVNLTLRPGLTVSGRISVEGDPGIAAPDFTRMRVSLTNQEGTTTNAVLTADGQFTIEGVVPEISRLTVFPPPGIPGGPAWFVKSGVLAGRDAIDAPVDISASVRNAAIVLTNRIGELSGTIADAAGKAATEYVVILFPSDPALWKWQSRRIQTARPSNDGKFTFRNLPAGDYLLGAVTEVEQYQWYEPAFLTELSVASVKLTLTEGEKKRQDLQIK